MNEQSFESSSNVLEPRVGPQVQERPSAEAPNITSDVPKPDGESQGLDESLWRNTADVGYQAHPTGVIRTRWKRKGKFLQLTDSWHMLSIPINPALGYRAYHPKGLQEGKQRYVHRTIAETFIPKPEGLKVEVNHKNGVKHDNRVENLEWVTRSQNCIHKRQELGWRGERCTYAKLTEAQVLEIRSIWDSPDTSKTIRAIAATYSVNRGAITDIVYNKTWRHLPLCKRKHRRIPFHEADVKTW